ncbi:MAG TPA: P1 family peptidase [Candidatus Polarisedimenticolia bacterium]|nr:P1 family peptidase [Candidatus Polarisedimenticolia bacterium]
MTRSRVILLLGALGAVALSWLSPAGAGAAAGKAEGGARRRLRDLGIVVGRMAPGPLDAITDVRGVRVGQVTLNRGDGKLRPGEGPVRTGVTAILPHGGDLWREKVPAATWVLNGTGEMTGSIWVDTQGALEVPIVLTNTMNVGRAMDGVVTYMLKHYPDVGIGDDVVAPTVAECDDSTLNDARGLHVSVEDTVRAIESASAGPVAEGAVGAGTGMMAFDFKGGIGTASRVLTSGQGGWTVGVLVNANMDVRRNLLVSGVPVGREITDLMPIEIDREDSTSEGAAADAEEGAAADAEDDGSIIIVVATDAPLDHLKLQRLASKAALGLARTGAVSRHGSGDLVIAFSTGNRVPHRPKPLTYTMTVVADRHLNPIFQAAEEATEEAILNSLTMATTTVGRDGNTAYALPLDRLVAIMKKYGRPTAARRASGEAAAIGGTR